MDEMNYTQAMQDAQAAMDADNAQAMQGVQQAEQAAQETQKAKDYKLEVNVHPIPDPKGRSLAFASVAIEDMVAIRGIQLIQGNNGLIVSMPQSRGKDRKFHDIAFPLNGDLRKQITKAVMEEYGKAAELSAVKQERLADKMREGAAKVAAQNAERGSQPAVPGKKQEQIA